MRRLSPMLLTTVFALLVAAAPRAAGTDRAATPQAMLDRLAWLEGTWQGVSNGVVMEEIWSSPAGGGLIGMHRDSRGGRLVSFEFFRVVPDTAGRICYLASPLGRRPVPFCAVSVTDSAALFEKPDHDFPQRILYRRTADGRLHARIEGTMNGAPAAEEWFWSRRAPR